MKPTALYLGRNLYVGGAERVWGSYLNHARRVRAIGVLLDARGPLLAEVRPDVELYDLSGPDRVVPPVVRSSGLAPGHDSVAKWKIFREAYRLGRIVRETEADVVSSFLMRSHMVALLAKEMWCRDVRLVFNVHSMMIQSAHHLYPDPASLSLMRGFLKWGFPRADRIVVVAEGVAEELRTHHPSLAPLIAVAHNPLDLQGIREAATRGSRLQDVEGPIIVAAGRLVALKGLDVLLDAVARMREVRPSVVLVGDGPEAPALRARAERLGLADRVHLVGETRNPWSYMAQATVLALSSRTEAFPNVIGEAMALGVPVVATSCAPGVAEYLGNGRCGLLVPPDDPARLAEALERVLQDSELRTGVSRQGLEQVERFGLAPGVDRYERLLVDAIRA